MKQPVSWKVTVFLGSDWIDTLHKTNDLPQKRNGWKTTFLVRYYQRRAHRIYFLYLNQLEYDDFPKKNQDS